MFRMSNRKPPDNLGFSPCQSVPEANSNFDVHEISVQILRSLSLAQSALLWGWPSALPLVESISASVWHWQKARDPTLSPLICYWLSVKARQALWDVIGWTSRPAIGWGHWGCGQSRRYSRRPGWRRWLQVCPCWARWSPQSWVDLKRVERLLATTSTDLFNLDSWLYTVKKVNDFPVPSRDITYQTLPGREQFNFSRPGRVW